MKVIGITGGIGSGKTTVSNIFGVLGVPVFNSDEEAKKLYQEVGIKSKLHKMFGKKIFDAAGEIDKAKLAQLVFANNRALAQLNGLVHPAVRKRFYAWKDQHKGSKMVIKEAAIMIESGAIRDIDYLVMVKASKQLKISRLIKSRNLSKSEIEGRMKEQLSDLEREKYADAVILNDEKHSLIKQVNKLYQKLMT